MHNCGVRGLSSHKKPMNDINRRRFQSGSLKDDGDRWVIRWREDQLDPLTGQTKRVRKGELLSKKRFQTKRLAQRELGRRVAEVNREDYKPVASGVTFAEFAATWTNRVAMYLKPSTRDSAKAILKCHVLPAFGGTASC